MPTNSAVATGTQELLIQLGLLLLGGFSALILLSFGGQLIVAPALLPVQWMVARNTPGPYSMAFSLLGALLTAEVAGLLVGLLAVWLGLPSVLTTIVVLGGALTGILFFKTSRPTES